MKTLIVLAAGLAVTVVIGLAIWVSGHDDTDRPAAAADGNEPLFYRHPMNPSVTSPVPAKDDMGMDYIPVYAGEADTDDGALVRISPTIVNNLGVRTAPATLGPLAREIDTVGYIAFDERLQSQVNLRVEGWIEDLQVRTLGEPVRKGDLLFEVYSPDLEAAQREYLQSAPAGRAALQAAGARRLRALGLQESQIERLNETRQPEPLVPVFARQDGIVAELNVREGVFVTPGTAVMTLAGLESVWVLVEVFEQQMDWVAVGQTATVQLPHKPGRVWDGEVEYIYPQLDPKTRTLRVRLRFANPGQLLRPNMYAEVTIHADPRANVISVPSAAVIRTGDGARVIRALGDGRFDPVPVVAGIESEGRVEILEGSLAPGDAVVVSAQFLIDSEASVQASLRRMEAPEDGAEATNGTAAPSAITGAGTFNRIDPDARTINLSHEPIDALNWPAMTMDFALDDDMTLPALEPAQRVRFRLRQTDGGYVITELAPAE